MKSHKFKSDGSDNYSMIVFCEYCGHIAWWGNSGNTEKTEMQKVAKEDCPQSKDVEVEP